ncbi:MAG TPA: CARDB domain-containing protein [Gemmatimonadaceae bacterium]|nr:CARDB domain-containing protein [Gemmatimonadaceae bacterium]
MRSRLIGLAVLAVVAGCTDSTPTSTLAKNPGSLRKVVVTGSLDQNINTLIGLWPQGLSTASGTRWQNIKDSYNAGQISVAKSKLVELTKFINNKTGDMTQPPAGETKKAAAARLVLYMALYIYNGPNTTPPNYSPDADNAMGVLTASQPLTVVTPSTHAGAQFEAGSTSEDRIIVITQNPDPYPVECSGPLQTTACQYPLFYHIESFPAGRLLKTAKAAICHINSGTDRYPLADHDRFRLAHTKPANSADYTTGSTIRDNIEILPLVSQSFVFCDNVSQPPVIASNIFRRGLQMVGALATNVLHAASPKSAYAIDQGGGGGFNIMSPFNNVDPQSKQDLNVLSFSTPGGSVISGTNATISYTIKNTGTGTSNAGTGSIRISTDAIITASDPLLASIAVPSLPPKSTDVVTNLPVAIPPAASLAPGSYYIGILVDDIAATPDGDVLNNTAASAVSVTNTIPNPIITLQNTTTSAGSVQYDIPVTNWASYPASMFVARPDLPPCGLNTSASQTWVEIYNGDTNQQVYGFCALGTPSDLQNIWVSFPTTAPQPCYLYIKLNDRGTNTIYTSNVIPTNQCAIIN